MTSEPIDPSSGMKVSVVTVCRNACPQLEETMLSVLGQTYADLEYIVIDGTSTDGTVDLLERYARRYPDCLTYVSAPDRGIYDAMNKGLARVTGEWVNFMNAGDTFASNEVLESVFGPHGALQACSNLQAIRVIGGGTTNVFADGHVVEHYAEPAHVIPIRLPFSHQATFVRCKPEPFVFDTTYTYAADYKVLYELYYAVGQESFLILDFPVARYRKAGSLTSDPRNARKVRGEYLRIQSAHRSLHWWKEYLKWRLLL